MNIQKGNEYLPYLKLSSLLVLQIIEEGCGSRVDGLNQFHFCFIRKHWQGTRAWVKRDPKSCQRWAQSQFPRLWLVREKYFVFFVMQYTIQRCWNLKLTLLLFIYTWSMNPHPHVLPRFPQTHWESWHILKYMCKVNNMQLQ